MKLKAYKEKNQNLLLKWLIISFLKLTVKGSQDDKYKTEHNKEDDDNHITIMTIKVKTRFLVTLVY